MSNSSELYQFCDITEFGIASDDRGGPFGVAIIEYAANANIIITLLFD